MTTIARAVVVVCIKNRQLRSSRGGVQSFPGFKRWMDQSRKNAVEAHWCARRRKRVRLSLAEGLSNGRVPRCATTAFTTSNRALRKLATSSPRATSVPAREDSRRQKIRTSRFAFYRELNWPLLTRLSACHLRLWPWHDCVIEQKTAIFRQINKDRVVAHHDALEFPDGQLVLLTCLSEGQQATVLQLPAAPKTVVESEAQRRAAYIG